MYFVSSDDWQLADDFIHNSGAFPNNRLIQRFRLAVKSQRSKESPIKLAGFRFVPIRLLNLNLLNLKRQESTTGCIFGAAKKVAEVFFEERRFSHPALA